MTQHRIGIMGLGKMGRAILNGMLSHGVCTKDDVLLSGHSKNEELSREGFATTTDVNVLASSVEILILAIKPQAFAEALSPLRSEPRHLTVVSIAAGKSIASITSFFGPVPVVRVMPNTPAMIGQGTSALARSAETTDEAFAQVRAIFNALGTTVEIPEALMDGVIALSGSMPAFVYLFIKDFVAAGVEMGFTEAEALSLVTQTIKGSVAMVETQGKTLEELITDVSSKGGTTIAGLLALHENGFDEAIKACANAAVKRSKELSGK